jgi:hypothetical protein
MIFTKEQIQEILNIVEYHHLFTIATGFGTSVLSDEDLNLLLSYGVKLDDITSDIPLYDRMYYFGRLTGILRENQSKTIDYANFLKFVTTGQYISLTKQEQFQLDIAKRKTYTYLKGLKNKVKGEVEQTILSKMNYEHTIKESLITGVEKRKSISAIVSDIGHKLGTWKNDYGRIVETEMNNIFLEGRAMEYSRNGEDPLVYKQVFELACRHCIEKYLSNGIGSKPRVFKLSELIKNGTNIGKKVKDWVATLYGLHPFCRCLLRKIPRGYEWNEENQRFELSKTWERKIERKSKIKIQVGDLKFEV